MYKLMVVDDEQVAIESVKYIVDREIDNIKIVHTARSGREAIEKVANIKPDIIIMDIRMPGINGLEAIKEIQNIYTNIKFVIISAYEYFDFAKQAVELGVNEYLTKPVNKKSLVDTLRNVTDILDKEQRKRTYALEVKEKIDKMLTVVEHSFIYSLMLNQGEDFDFGKYKELFEITSGFGYMFVLKAVEIGKEKDSGRVQNQAYYPVFKDEIKYISKCIVGPVILDRVVVYVAENPNDEYSQLVKAIDMLEKIVAKLEGKFNIKFSVGIGSVKPDDDLILSYHEALKALNFGNEQKVTHIQDVSFKADRDGIELFGDMQKLIKYIEIGESKLCISILADIFNKNPDFFVKENLRNRLIEMIVAAHRIAIEDGIDSDDYLDYSKYINDLLAVKNKHEFEDMCIGKIGYIANKIKQNKQNNMGAIVDKANVIINQRFFQELTLDEISKELCVSPQYFSRLYKEQMGVNFIERLTTVRIDNAKMLMKQGTHSIKEICFKSGYNDPNYFSKLFKKHEGVSPSTYIKNV